MLLPLSETIKQNPPAKVLKLSPAEKEAFVAVNDILAKVFVLTHPDLDATQYHLVTDSSNYAIGAALLRIINGDPVPIGFYSKKLSENQRKYFTFNRELYQHTRRSSTLSYKLKAETSPCFQTISHFP